VRASGRWDPILVRLPLHRGGEPRKGFAIRQQARQESRAPVLPNPAKTDSGSRSSENPKVRCQVWPSGLSSTRIVTFSSAAVARKARSLGAS